MHWEYLTIKINPDHGFFSGQTLNYEKVNAKLNLLGQDRWELVSVMDVNAKYGTNEVALFFKRPQNK